MELQGNVQGLIKLLGGGSEVTITPILLEGVEIMRITVDQTEYLIYAPEGGGSEVSVSPILASGTKIATFIVDDTSYDIYAPSPTSVEVSPVLSAGTKIATITVNNQAFEIYAPTPEGMTFSTTEKVVGSWMDGKPLYQKTVVSTDTPSQNNWTTINLNIPSDAVICRYEGYYRRSPNKTDFILQYNPTASNEWIFGAMSNNNFVYKVGSPYVANFLETYITVWYTKATD